MIVDSGNRREFKSGAVRDISEGKGRCDLLPLREVSELTKSSVLEALAEFVETQAVVHIYYAIQLFCVENDLDIYTAMLEVSSHFEEGAKKYSPNNWRKGIDASCYLDSTVRHYLKHKRHDTDERHDRAFIWNCLCLVWTIRNREECNDLKGIDYGRKKGVQQEDNGL